MKNNKWADIRKYIKDNSHKIDCSKGVIGKKENGGNIWDEWDYYETTARISKMFNLNDNKDIDRLFSIMDKYTFAAY